MGSKGLILGAWQRYGTPGWGLTTCRASAGNYSAGPAADGMGAVTPCTDNHPNDLNVWLIHGPFDLRDVPAAEMNFQRWQRTELIYDLFKWVASIDGQDFYGWQSSGNSQGWYDTSLDLSNVPILGDLRGEPQVWVALILKSDESETDLGVLLDNVVIRKQKGGGAAVSLPQPARGLQISPAHDRRP